MTPEELRKAALAYHHDGAPGKISVVATKPCNTAQDLSLAYTPGVAQPCLAIRETPADVWNYTSRGNLVAVVSDGTAVLGLGNIGPEAGLPVMEGKAVLFKHFADIDAVPVCLGKVFNEKGRTDAARVIETVERLEPTFGGINLEDIGAPACFEVEQTLKKRMNIPVFHDDQHGTAIISLAAIINALKMVGKKIEDCRFVVNGAGAAGIACSRFYITAGAKRSNFIMCDSKGVIYKGRTDLNPEKQEFAAETDARTLADAMKGADIFLGFSAPNCVTAEMVKSMNKGAVIFAMANPVPEILDVRARDINEAMKLAAANALAELAAESIPADVKEQLTAAYPADAAAGMFEGESQLKATYVIPKPFDPRVVPRVAMRVAEAAMKTGVAQLKIEDLKEYEKSVAKRIKK